MKYARVRGFTLIELIIVMAVIGILASIVFSSLNIQRERAYDAKAVIEVRTIYGAILQYRDDYRAFPADVARGLPNGLEQYLGPGAWPDGPWPNSVYDWDNWTDPDDPSKRIIQISIRFCEAGQPDTCQFPDRPWAAGFGVNSSVYYCVRGTCRSHISEDVDYPGVCVNCGEGTTTVD